MMKTIACLVLAIGTLASIPLASAENIPNAISPNLTVSVQGKPLNNGSQIFVGRAICTPETQFEFKIANYTGMVPVVEAWVGAGGGVDCSLAENRISSAYQDSRCQQVATVDNVQANTSVTVMVSAVELFSRNGATCDEVTRLPYTLYFVPLAQATQAGTDTAGETLVNTQVLRATFTLYTLPPSAPSDLTDSPEDPTLDLAWEPPSTADEHTSYRLYLDLAQDGTGEVPCGSGALRAGMDAPAANHGIIALAQTFAGAVLPPHEDIEAGQEIAAGVVSIDAAGNASVMSEVICIQAPQHSKGGGGGCSVRLPGSPKWPGFGALAGLGLMFWMRRLRGVDRAALVRR